MPEPSAARRIAMICAPAQVQTVGSRLLDEIERVVAKRERWRQFAEKFGMPGEFAPALTFMTAAIDAAKAALFDDDEIASLDALRALQGFSDND